MEKAASLEGKLDGSYDQWPRRELCWQILDRSPLLTFSDWMDTWHSVTEQGEMFNWRSPANKRIRKKLCTIL